MPTAALWKNEEIIGEIMPTSLKSAAATDPNGIAPIPATAVANWHTLLDENEASLDISNYVQTPDVGPIQYQAWGTITGFTTRTAAILGYDDTYKWTEAHGYGSKVGFPPGFFPYLQGVPYLSQVFGMTYPEFPSTGWSYQRITPADNHVTRAQFSLAPFFLLDANPYAIFLYAMYGKICCDYAGFTPTISLPVSEYVPSHWQFSAVFNDPNTLDESAKVDIQVTTDATFMTVTHWNATALALTSTCAKGDRCADIVYAGSALTAGVTYHWRMRFYDSTNLTSAWAVGTFQATPPEVISIAVCYEPNGITHVVRNDSLSLEAHRRMRGAALPVSGIQLSGNAADNPAGICEIAGRLYLYYDRQGVARYAISKKDGTEWLVSDMANVTALTDYVLKHVCQMGRVQFAVMYREVGDDKRIYFSRNVSADTTTWETPVQVVGSLSAEPSAWLVPQPDGKLVCYYQVGTDVPVALSCGRQDGGGSWA